MEISLEFEQHLPGLGQVTLIFCINMKKLDAKD